MEIKKTEQKRDVCTIKITAMEGGKETGRAYLYLIFNDLHKEPYGLLEDVFVEESERGKGTGNLLLQEIIKEAKARGCYKLIATSRVERDSVHAWYERHGFKNYGLEFRMDLK